ncbi:MAG: potassium channel protein [Methylococcales bacterium]|nr:potassium channel protein [Methylococcales bacterium]
MFTHSLLSCCYWLKRNPGYQALKTRSNDTLNVVHHPIKQRFDRFMIGVVLLSLAGILPKDSLPQGVNYLLEYAVTAVFIAELTLRAWLSYPLHQTVIERFEQQRYLDLPFHATSTLLGTLLGKLRFFLTPLAIIDVLAIIPVFLPEQEVGFWYVFRLLKFFRYSNSVMLFTEVLGSKRLELMTLVVFMSFLVFIASAGFYMFEQPQEGKKLEQLLDAFYWSVVTMATVGYGDITPKTAGGKIVTLALIISGIWVLSFFTSVIVAAIQDKLHQVRDQKMAQEINALDSFYLICGFGRVGQEVCRHLVNSHKPFVVIEQNRDLAWEAKAQSYLTFTGDASHNELLLNAGLNQGAQTVLCTTGDDVINVYITLSCRALNPDVNIIARANHRENIRKLYQAGANYVVQPYEIASMLAAEYVGQPVAFEAIMGILNAEQDVSLDSLELNENAVKHYPTLAALELHRRKVLLLGVISQAATSDRTTTGLRYLLSSRFFYFNPEPDFPLQAGDMLVVLGRNISLAYYQKQLQRFS